MNRKRDECDCGNKAVIPQNGTMVCTDCARKDKPHRTHVKKIGVHAHRDYSGAHIDWEHYYLPDRTGEHPITGDSLKILDKWMSAAIA